MRIYSRLILSVWIVGATSAALSAPPAFAQNPPGGQGQNGARRQGQNRPRRQRATVGNTQGLQVIRKELPAARLDPASVEEIKHAAIPFKPFRWMDPKTRKPATGSEMITLPNGRMVQADKYYDQLDAAEKDLNRRGFSLRNKEKIMVLNQIKIENGKLKAQTDKIAADHSAAGAKIAIKKVRMLPPNSSTSAILRNHLTVQDSRVFGLSPQEFQAASRRIGNMPLQLNNIQELVNHADEIQTGTPNSTGNTPAQPRRRKKTSLLFTTDTPNRLGCATDTMATTSAPSPILRLPKKINQSKNWDWNVGSASSFGAYLHIGESLTGEAYPLPDKPTKDQLHDNKSHFELHGDAKAGGSLFGLNIDVLQGSADFKTDHKQVRANIDISVLGQSVYNVDETKPTQLSKADTLSKGVDFHTTIPIQIWIFTVNITLGAKGEAGIKYGIDLYGGDLPYISGWVDPFVHTSVYAEAAVGIGLGDWLGVEVGVGANLVLLNDDLDIRGQLGETWFIKFGLFQKLAITNNLEMLSGNVYVFAQIDYPCFPDFWDSCNSQARFSLFDWTGFTINSDLFNYDKSGPL